MSQGPEDFGLLPGVPRALPPAPFRVATSQDVVALGEKYYENDQARQRHVADLLSLVAPIWEQAAITGNYLLAECAEKGTLKLAKPKQAKRRTLTWQYEHAVRYCDRYDLAGDEGFDEYDDEPLVDPKEADAPLKRAKTSCELDVDTQGTTSAEQVLAVRGLRVRTHLMHKKESPRQLNNPFLFGVDLAAPASSGISNLTFTSTSFPPDPTGGCTVLNYPDILPVVSKLDSYMLGHALDGRVAGRKDSTSRYRFKLDIKSDPLVTLSCQSGNVPGRIKHAQSDFAYSNKSGRYNNSMSKPNPTQNLNLRRYLYNLDGLELPTVIELTKNVLNTLKI